MHGSPHLSRQRTGWPVLAVLTGLALFTAMDGFMKASSIAVGAYSAVFWRNLMGAAIMAPLWLRRTSRWPDKQSLRLHLLRGGVSSAMTLLFFWGLVRTPMAEAMALSFIAPLIALFLAAIWLGEQVAPRAVGGSVLALCGVIVIAAGRFTTERLDAAGVTDEKLAGLVAILLSAVLYGWNLVLQRRQAQVARPEEIAFFQALVVFIVLGVGAPWFLAVPNLPTFALLGTAAVIASASLMLLSWAYARAEAQALVPLEFTAFIWAAITGWIAFAEPVTWFTLAGVALIISGCLFATAARRGGKPALSVQDKNA